MEKFDIEKMKKDAGTCCCLDWNGAIGRNLEEKLQVVYVTLVRMQHITKKMSGLLPDVILAQPLVTAMLDITSVMHKTRNDQVRDYPFVGRAWNMWDVYREEEAWMEHHILMTNLIDGDISLDPKYWCKVSLLNLVMSNNFGYFNMAC